MPLGSPISYNFWRSMILSTLKPIISRDPTASWSNMAAGGSSSCHLSGKPDGRNGTWRVHPSLIRCLLENSGTSASILLLRISATWPILNAGEAECSSVIVWVLLLRSQDSSIGTPWSPPSLLLQGQVLSRQHFNPTASGADSLLPS